MIQKELDIYILAVFQIIARKYFTKAHRSQQFWKSAPATKKSSVFLDFSKTGKLCKSSVEF